MSLLQTYIHPKGHDNRIGLSRLMHFLHRAVWKSSCENFVQRSRLFLHTKKNDIPLEFVTCSELLLGNVLVEFCLKCSFDEPTAYCMLLWSLGKLVANYCINFGPLLLVFVVLRRRYKVMEYLSTASALTLRCIDPYRNNPQLTSASKSVQKINCMPCNFRYLRRDVAN